MKKRIQNTNCLRKEFRIYFAFVILFIGGIGWVLPSPGGIGTTHFILLHLFLVFGHDEFVGATFGVLSNGLTFIITIAYGLIAILITLIRNYYRKTKGIDKVII